MVLNPWSFPSEAEQLREEVERCRGLDFSQRLAIVEELVAFNDAISRSSPHREWQLQELARIEEEGNERMRQFIWKWIAGHPPTTDPVP